jgi:hypothetical protein
MNMNLLAAAIVAGMSISAAPFAQTPSLPDRPGERAGPMTPERKCDALTGAKKEQCLRDARRRPDGTAQGPGGRGSCDALVGPEKELCLKRGGTVEAGATSGAGGTAGQPAK